MCHVLAPQDSRIFPIFFSGLGYIFKSIQPCALPRFSSGCSSTLVCGNLPRPNHHIMSTIDVPYLWSYLILPSQTGREVLP